MLDFPGKGTVIQSHDMSLDEQCRFFGFPVSQEFDRAFRASTTSGDRQGEVPDFNLVGLLDSNGVV